MITATEQFHASIPLRISSLYFSQNLYIPNPINAAGIIHNKTTIIHFRITATTSLGTLSVTPAIVKITECIRTTNTEIPFPNPLKNPMVSSQNALCRITDKTVITKHIMVSTPTYPCIAVFFV